MAISLLIASGHRLLSYALAGALQGPQFLLPDGGGEFEVAETFPTTPAHTVGAVRLVKPDIALVECLLSGVDGAVISRSISREAPAIRVILFSRSDRVDQLEEALEAGAADLLPNDVTILEVADAIRRAYTGEMPIYDRLAVRTYPEQEIDGQADLLDRAVDGLTDLEYAILSRMSARMTATKIASEVGVSLAALREKVYGIIEKSLRE